MQFITIIYSYVTYVLLRFNRYLFRHYDLIVIHIYLRNFCLYSDVRNKRSPAKRRIISTKIIDR